MEREPDTELTAELHDLIRRGADCEERTVLLSTADVDRGTAERLGKAEE